MVAADDQVRAAVVLADQGVEKRLAGSRVAHLDRVAGLDHRARHEVVVDHGLDGAGADVRRDVAGLQLAQHLVDEHPVGDLDRDFHQMLVRPLHGIAGLEGGHPRPAVFEKQGSRLRGTDVEIRELPGIAALGQASHTSGEVDLALLHDLVHTGVGSIGGAVDVFALECLVGRVFFHDLHDGQDFPACPVDQRHFLLDVNAAGQVRLAGKRDGDRPEHAALQLHLETDAAPVGLPHESFRWACRRPSPSSERRIPRGWSSALVSGPGRAPVLRRARCWGSAGGSGHCRHGAAPDWTLFLPPDDRGCAPVRATIMTRCLPSVEKFVKQKPYITNFAYN